ncbi:MAG: LysM peptidoglycan-binding domain-containing protein, partial [Chitinispirillia bacterium]
LYLTGCTPFFLKHKNFLKKVDIYYADETDTIPKIPEISEITSSDTLNTKEVIDSLIENAHRECNDLNFSYAHNLLTRAVHLIESENGLSEGEWNDSNNYFIEIATIYTSKLPQIYLDSIPENITSMIFRYQLAASIDTISMSSEDSLLLLNPECEHGLPYNIPIVRNKRVNKALLYIIKNRSNIMGKLLARANHYLPFMQRMFNRNDLPTDIVYLPILESGFNPKAYSYAHASGIWQFIPETGKRYGLRYNYWIDERRDPIKSTAAAIGYLKKLYNDFQDWYLALAAYNCGENRIARTIEKYGTNDYWRLKLPRETMNYIPQFIAYQLIGKNPQCFGIQVEPSDTFNLDTIHISDCLDLNKIAEGLNISYTELKQINPHIRHWCTPPDMNNVILYLPNGAAEKYKTFYKTLSVNDKVKWYRYRIKNGDNLGRISRRFKIPVNAIKSINKLRSNFIYAGRYLYIPIPVAGQYPTFTNSPIQRVALKTSISSNRGNVTSSKDSKRIKYKISRGETLYSISKNFNISIKDICRWNSISNPRKIREGKVIVLYLKDSSEITGKFKQKLDRNTYVVLNGDNLYKIARKLNIDVNKLAQWNGINYHRHTIYPGNKLIYYSPSLSKKKFASSSNNSGTITYRIKKGDNISSLAKIFSVDIQQILHLNNLEINSIIQPGDIIRIPTMNN